MIQQNYIGCDVSKDALDLFDPARGRACRIANQTGAITAYVAGLDAGRDFVVMEATGIHDRELRHVLGNAGVPFTRRNPARIHHFAQSDRQRAKTDSLDAHMLADYGRRFTPAPDEPVCREREHLAALSRRRDQLVEARAVEKRHLSQAFDAEVAKDIARMIAILDERVAAIEAVIKKTIHDVDISTAQDYAILVSAPGVGSVTAVSLIALMPELGHRSPKTIAALGGLAPFNNDSGKKNGRRLIRGGRARVRRALYMAALGAVRKCSRMRAFYNAIATRSASKKLALIAVARKLLTILNAMIRDRKTYA